MAHNSVGFSDPLTLELDVIGPKANPTRGEPVESGKVLLADAHIEAGVWECTRIKSSVELRVADGNVTPFTAGTALAIPEGWVGEWDIAETTRKVYVVSYTAPRA